MPSCASVSLKNNRVSRLMRTLKSLRLAAAARQEMAVTRHTKEMKTLMRSTVKAQGTYFNCQRSFFLVEAGFGVESSSGMTL